MKDPAIRHQLLLATIDCIEKFGIEGCTIRNIAKEAGMAFSSLHYYFESKEQMIQEAMTLALNNSLGDLEEMWANRTDDISAIREMLLFLFDGALKFPGITRASLHSLLMKGETDGLASRIFNQVFSVVVDDIATAHPVDRHKLTLQLANALSSLLYNGISPHAYLEGMHLDFSLRENRIQSVDMLISGLLTP